MTKRATLRDAFLLLGFCGFLFFYGLSSFGLIGADEPRYAQVAREMLARHDWITPTLGGVPWLEKPALYYWQAILSYKLFGVSDWAARIPSAFDATLMVAAIYIFLSRLRFVGGFPLDGALIVASSVAIIGFARAASTDMPLAAMFTIAMLCWFLGYEQQRKPMLALSYFFLALATLAKGPVAPFLALVIVVLFAALRHEIAIIWKTLWLPGILLFCAVCVPWYIAVQIKNPEFFRTFILQHNLARFGSNLYHHPAPFWYYIPVALVSLLPWTVFALASLWRSIRSWTKRPESSDSALPQFLALWTLIPIAFFSLSQSKLPGYILPAIPAGALLVVTYVNSMAKNSTLPGRTLIALHSVVAASIILPPLMSAYLLTEHSVPWGKPAIVPLAVTLLLAVLLAALLRSNSGLRLFRIVTLVPIVIALALIFRFAPPLLDEQFSARPIAQQIAPLAPPSGQVMVFRVRREISYGLAFYRNQPVGRYGDNPVPPGEHLVVATSGSQAELASDLPGRFVTLVGSYAPQKLEYFWVSAAAIR
jgi:4-amino-4-deoxy-L-arabinose transferase-like glycosyltransferase